VKLRSPNSSSSNSSSLYALPLFIPGLGWLENPGSWMLIGQKKRFSVETELDGEQMTNGYKWFKLTCHFLFWIPRLNG
jgi:hypothetical protein